MQEFYWSCVLRVGVSGVLDAKHGKIIPSYREIAGETSCPSLRVGPALSMRWGFARGVDGGKGPTNHHRKGQDGPPAHHSVLCSGGTHRSKTDSWKHDRKAEM